MIREFLLALGLGAAVCVAAASGDLDPTFGRGGVALSHIAYGGGGAAAVAAQPDGKLLVGGGAVLGAGGALTLMRYNSDGSPDRSFGQSGLVALTRPRIATITDLALQADGRIVAAAASFTNGEAQFAVLRFLPDGSLDGSFGAGGVAMLSTAYTATARAVAVQSDGRIVLAGDAQAHAMVARFNANGSLDTAFANSGIAFVSRPAMRAVAFNDVAIQPDGAIVAVGSDWETGRSEMFLARFDGTGRPDVAFGIGGEVLTSWNGLGVQGYRVAIQPDGRIVVAGSEESIAPLIPVARYTAAGALDPTFGGDGRADVASPGRVALGLGVQAGGKIVVLGYAHDSLESDGIVARLNADGSQDSPFGLGNGYGRINVTAGADFGRAMALLADGRIAIAGTTPSPSNPGATAALAGLWSRDGHPDASFNATGYAAADAGTTLAIPYALALLPDGRILAGGIVEGGTAVITRHAEDGALDATFGAAGVVMLEGMRASAIVRQSDGRIVVAGTDGRSGRWEMVVVRLLADGALDPAFGSGGRAQFVIDARGSSQAFAAAIQADGRIVVAGCGNSGSADHMAFIRLLPSGAIDGSFGGGVVHFAFDATTWDCVGAIALQGDGMIVGAGRRYGPSNDNRGMAVVRVTPAGVLDASFGAAGKVEAFVASAGAAYALAIQPDGRIVAGGTASNAGDADFALARWLSDGRPDAAFGAGGTTTLDFGAKLEAAHAVALLGDGRIVAAGRSDMTYLPNDPGTIPVTVLRADGSPDGAFGDGGVKRLDPTIGEDGAYAVAVLPGGKLLFAADAMGQYALIRLDMAAVSASPARKPGDMDGDGSADLVLGNSDGRIAAWLMDGTAATATANLIGAGQGWTVTHTADLSGDGKADILLNHTDGRVYLYVMDGLTVAVGRELLGAGQGWSVAATGDLNGDGKADLLLKNLDGRSHLWLMNGINIIGSASLQPAGSPWTVTHTGDFNADGKADIVWKNTDGRAYLYLMNGTTVTAGAEFLAPASGWIVSHVADMDGDGKSDLVFRHTDGRAHLYLMNGTAFGPGAQILGPGTGWIVSHTGDFNADGRSDLVFRHADGRAHLRLMNGAATVAGRDVLPAGSGWSVAQTHDHDGDGKADLVFRHADGRVTVRLQDGLNETASANLLPAGGGWSVVP